MKNILVIIIVAVLIWSCDTRFDEVAKFNTPPVLTFSGGATSLVDSLKTGLSIKFKKEPYSFGLVAYDKENLLDGLDYSITGSKWGTSLFTYNGADAPQGVIPIETSAT